MAVDRLYQAVHSSERRYDPKQVRDRVDDVLRLILTREWEPSDENPLPDPFVRSVLLSVLTPDGRWKNVKFVTPILAQLKRMIVSGPDKIFCGVMRG